MSLPSTITINAATIPTPSIYHIGFYLPGVVAAGVAAKRSWVQAFTYNALREFTLEWNTLTELNCAELRGIFGALCTDVCPFTDPRGVDYNVIRHPDQPKITFKAINLKTASSFDYLWSVTLRMVEVP